MTTSVVSVTSNEGVTNVPESDHAHPWPGPNAARDAPRAAAGDGGRDGYVLPRVGLRIHSSPQELIGSNSWSGESVSEVPPASIQVEVARLHAPRRNAGRQTRYRAAPTIHANPFHVLAEAA